jgi:sulfatase maturation enzyme AslB (radical SAM superfamily)
LRCIYCYARGGDNPKPVTIPVDAARAGIDFVAGNAVRQGRDAFSVGFHGAGEPTIAWSAYTDLVAYARRRAKELGLRVSCATCTNGVMSEAHAR